MTTANDDSFSGIKEEFARYFETEFSDETADSRANEAMRLKLRDFILNAACRNDAEMVRRAIEFLLQNTGCEEDFRIYEAIKAMLLAKSVIPAEELAAFEKRSPVSRWRHAARAGPRLRHASLIAPS